MSEKVMGNLPKIKTSRAVAKLLKMIFQDGKWIFAGEIGIVAVCSILPVLTAYFWQQILGRTTEAPPALLVFFISMALSGGLALSNGYFREVFDTIFRNSVSKNMQKRVHKKAEHLPLDDYEDASLNDLLTCAGEKFFYGDVLGFLMQGVYTLQVVVSIVLTGFLVWSYHPILVLPFVGMMGTQALGLFSNRKKIELDLALVPIRRRQQVYKEYLTKYENIKEVRSLGVHGVFCEKWRQSLQEAMVYEERITRSIYLLRLVQDVVKRLTMVAAYFLCIYLTDRYIVGIGQFGAVILLMQQFQNSSSELVERIQEVHASAVHVQNGLAYFELPEEQRENTLEQPLHTITLEQASYRYPGANRFAVEDIQLELKKNKIYAVVGKNGSGKTTLSRLICGLLVPTEGVVRFNEVLAEEIVHESLFERTSAVLQDFSRYAMTVRENILLGDIHKNASDQEVIELAESMKVNFFQKRVMCPWIRNWVWNMEGSSCQAGSGSSWRFCGQSIKMRTL